MVCRLFGVSEDWGFGNGFGWLMEFSIVRCFSWRVWWGFFFFFFFFFDQQSQVPCSCLCCMSRSTTAMLYCNSGAATCFHFILRFSRTRRGLALICLVFALSLKGVFRALCSVG